eukprot:SM000015S01230  [mRNA]  locus=s15:768528:771505:+ [translate_table: standard]
MAAGAAPPSRPSGGSSGLRQPKPKVDTSRFKVTGDGVLAASAAAAAVAAAAAPKQHSPIDIFKLVSPSASRRRQRSPGPHALGGPSTPAVAVTATSRLPQEAAASPLLASQTAARSAAESGKPTIHPDVPRHHQQGPGTGVTTAEAMQSLATAARAEKPASAAGRATSKRSAGSVSEREPAQADDVAAGRRRSASCMGVSQQELAPLGAAPGDAVESPATGPQHGEKASVGFDTTSGLPMRTSRLKLSAGGHLQGLLSEEDLRDILSSGNATVPSAVSPGGSPIVVPEMSAEDLQAVLEELGRGLRPQNTSHQQYPEYDTAEEAHLVEPAAVVSTTPRGKRSTTDNAASTLSDVPSTGNGMRSGEIARVATEVASLRQPDSMPCSSSDVQGASSPSRVLMSSPALSSTSDAPCHEPQATAECSVPVDPDCCVPAWPSSTCAAVEASAGAGSSMAGGTDRGGKQLPVELVSQLLQTTACTRRQDERHLSLTAASPDLEQAQSQSPVLEKSETPTGSPSNCKRMVRRRGPAVQLESSAGVLDSEEVSGMQELDPLWEEKICAAEAAGLAGLLAKKGAVQNSPPDATKEPETPNPWSPVRKSGGLGPFDCTKRVSVEMCTSVEAA